MTFPQVGPEDRVEANTKPWRRRHDGVIYLRLKGEMEAALAGLGFDRLDIVRPGLLRGRARADGG